MARADRAEVLCDWLAKVVLSAPYAVPLAGFLQIAAVSVPGFVKHWLALLSCRKQLQTGAVPGSCHYQLRC